MKLSWQGYRQRLQEMRSVRIIWEERTEMNKKRGNSRQKLYKAIARILERSRYCGGDAKKPGETKKRWKKHFHN